MVEKILFALVLILTLVSVGKLLNIGDLINQVRGRKSYEITEKENNWNAFFCLLMLFGSWLLYFYFHNKYVTGGLLLPGAASEHGVAIDKLNEVSFIIISIAYLLVQPVLWFFAFRYRYKKENKAFHYAHNNRLELVWTVAPAIVFCGLIFYGLKIWNESVAHKIVGEKLTIELYARQFDWHARYAGADEELGAVNYSMISDVNALGMITEETINAQFARITERRNETIKKLSSFPLAKEIPVLEKELIQYNHQLQLITQFKKKNETAKYISGYDDIILAPGSEIHIPVGVPIDLKMRSQDVIHSAYLPHFRVHMYCVPGMETSFPFIPTLTTSEMKVKLNNPDFDFLLYCNNICGSAHYNMQMKIVVDSPADYERWLKKQKTYAEEIGAEGTGIKVAETDTLSTTGTASL